MTVLPPPHPKRSRGGRLISQGAYGCVYKPGLRCPNAPRGAAAARGTVSKLQRAGRAASTEVAIGARIRQTMPRYAQRFAPVVESCAVSKTQLPEGTAEGCRAVQDDEEEGGKSKNKNNNSDLVIMRMPSAGEQTLGKYLSRRGRTISQIGETWRALRDSFVQLADDAGVVHFDFKGDNAMWSRARRAPVLIDFGLALYVPALLGDAPPLVAPVGSSGSDSSQDADAALWRQGFFALHPAYASWCPEAVLCASLWQSEIRGPQEDGSESTESPDKDEAAAAGNVAGGGGGSAWRSTDKLGAPELEHMRAALAACFERHPTFKLLLTASPSGGEMIQPRLDARRAKLEAWVAAQSGRTRLAAGRDMLRRTWRKWDRFALAGTVLNALLRRRRGISKDQQEEFELLTSTLAEEALEM